MTDERGVRGRQAAFMACRANGHCAVEGLTSSFLCARGGLGFIILQQTVQNMVDLFYSLDLCPIEFFHG